MTFRQIAFHNVLRNKRVYAAHFFSGAFAVMIFYIYALLLFHPQLQGELEATSKTIAQLAGYGMGISQYLILFFSFLFLMYSVSSFLKTRKREFAILMIHGLSPRQRNWLIMLENMLIGSASIVAGIAAGVILSKLVLLISANMLRIDSGLNFYMPVGAIGVTAGAFVVMYALIGLFTSKLVRVGSLIELLLAEDKPKPEPKVSAWRAVLAVLLLCSGYGAVLYFAIKEVYSLVLLASGVGLTVAGTYMLFTQFGVWIVRRLKNNERVLYNRTNVVTVTELAYRLKDNAVMLFMVSVVSAAAFVGLGCCLALANPGLSEMSNPYAFTYLSTVDNADEERHVEEIKQALEQAGFAYRLEEQQSSGYYSSYYIFDVDNWMETRAVAQELMGSIGRYGEDFKHHYFTSLALHWLQSRQQNGILLMIGVLIGVVFFTFAASFLYLRLYTDLGRDRRQYRMIAKIGLSGPELGRIVTRQLGLMFFAPIAVAVLHSAVAFVALQYMLDFSILWSSLGIFAVFAAIQTIYFALVRWRYLSHVRQELVQAE